MSNRRAAFFAGTAAIGTSVLRSDGAIAAGMDTKPDIDWSVHIMPPAFPMSPLQPTKRFPPSHFTFDFSLLPVCGDRGIATGTAQSL